jgi:hypothetical protein
MSELVALVEQQTKQLAELKGMVHNLTILVMKDKVDLTWLSEADAAEMLGIKHARGLRKRVVLTKKMMESGEKIQYPFNLIEYRNTNGRLFQYSRKSILKFKHVTSNQN